MRRPSRTCSTRPVELAPTIAARAAEIETARRLPRDLLDDLLRVGCFRVLRPRTHGGLGADLPEAMRIIESLARADASVAWTVMIGAATWIDLAGLPRATFDALFATPDVITAGVFNPTGSIAVAPGGYQVTGRWSFASGCEHADWLFGNCIEGVVDGVPQMRMAVLAPEQVVIEDTWTVSGLCGTGSHHFRADGILVPPERTWRPLVDPPCVDEPIVRIPPLALISLITASVPLGLAQGALDDIHALAAGKVPLLAGAPLAANPHFQYELATADTELRAARALLYEIGRVGVGDRHIRGRVHPGTARPDPRHRSVGHHPVGRGRGHRLPVRRRQLDLRRQPAATAAARRPRRDPALRGQTGHADHRRRHPRRPGRHLALVLKPRPAPHVSATSSEGIPYSGAFIGLRATRATENERCS